MKLIVLSGKVSGVKEDMNGACGTVRFRIDNRPVTTAISVNVMEGDMVTVVADDGTEPIVFALRNESTKVVYQPDEPKPARIPFVMIFSGVLLLAFLVGFLLLWMAWMKYQAGVAMYKSNREIRRLLASAPSPL